MKRLIAVILMCLWTAAQAAVNINTATQQELESVKGIGPAKARAIIQHREQHGPFVTLQDLRRVKGFGEKTVQRLAKDLSVAGPTVLDAPAR